MREPEDYTLISNPRRIEMRREFVRGLCGIAFFVGFFLVLCLGCSYRNPRPIPCGPGKATATGVTWWHTINGRVKKLTTIMITNPSNEDVILDCNRSRTRIHACEEADVLGERGCDLQNEITYSPNTEAQ